MARKKQSRGPSFFDLLAEQGQALVSASTLLQELVQASLQDRPELRNRLHDVEHDADDINHTFAKKLNQSFVTPFDREDMRELAGLLDDCVDLIDEAGDVIVLYNLEDIPPKFAKRISKQVSVLQDCSELTARAMPKMKKPMDLQPFWLEINVLENQADKVYRKTLAELFDSGLDAISIIKLKDVIELLEEAADAFEDLAHAVETIAVKES